jgi:hypothetical protein
VLPARLTQTVPSFHEPNDDGSENKWTIVGDTLEIIFNTIFTIELVVRVLLYADPRLVLDITLWCDFLAIAPFYIELATGKPIDVLKALRMLRLLKLSRQYDGSIVIVRALKGSMGALGVPMFFLLVAVIIFAAFVFYLESESSPTHHFIITNSTATGTTSEAAFNSIPQAIWFMLVTMTTVGFGDVSPNSNLGKFITSVAMIFGIIQLAMPLAIVGNNFVEVWDDRQRVIFIEKFKQHFFAMVSEAGALLFSHS